MLLVLLKQEFATGYASPTLLLDTPWSVGWSLLIVLAAVWPAQRTSAAVAVQGRRIGLDILRSFAVGCVVVAHGLPLLFPVWSSDG